MLIPTIHERKSWFFLLVIALVGLNLYFNYSYEEGLEQRAHRIDQFFSKAILPFQFMISSIQDLSTGGVKGLGDLIDAKKQNAELKEQLNTQALQLHALQEALSENERLKTLLGFRSTLPFHYIPAKIIGHDPSPFFQTMLIDRGESDGLKTQMPVLSSSGVVGRVFEVGTFSSKILLVTDPNSRVDAVVQRSRARAIVAGTSSGELQLRFMPRRQDIQEGDVLVSSGLGGLFPPGFPIGTVTTVRHDPNFVLDSSLVKAAVTFEAIEEVFIVTDLPGAKS